MVNLLFALVFLLADIQGTVIEVGSSDEGVTVNIPPNAAPKVGDTVVISKRDTGGATTPVGGEWEVTEVRSSSVIIKPVTGSEGGHVGFGDLAVIRTDTPDKQSSEDSDKMDPKQMHTMGNRYADGDGVPRNYALAMQWYMRSADAGYVPAINDVGWLYFKGLGVPRNYKAAVDWFTRAARLGNARAQTNLGWMYQHGLGVEGNTAEAVRWYKEAAAQGFEPAKINLEIILTGAAPPTPKTTDGSPADQASGQAGDSRDQPPVQAGRGSL